MLKLNIFTSHSVNSIRRLLKSPNSVSEDVSVVYLIIVLLSQRQGTEKAIYSNCFCFYSNLSLQLFDILSRSDTYFPGKDPVSYSLILLLSLFNGLATSPVLQWHTDLTFQRRYGEKMGKLVTTGKIYTYSHSLSVNLFTSDQKTDKGRHVRQRPEVSCYQNFLKLELSLSPHVGDVQNMM